MPPDKSEFTQQAKERNRIAANAMIKPPLQPAAFRSAIPWCITTNHLKQTTAILTGRDLGGFGTGVAGKLEQIGEFARGKMSKAGTSFRRWPATGAAELQRCNSWLHAVLSASELVYLDNCPTSQNSPTGAERTKIVSH